MDLSAVIDDLDDQPHRRREFYEYPALYDFYHERVLDRDAQVGLLRRFEPDRTRRVLELGCGTGPLLARIETDYDDVYGIDADEGMLERARDRLASATVLRADFTEWSAAEIGRSFDVAVLFGGLLHVTDDDDLASLAANVHESLRAGGAFVSFFEPLSGAVENGSSDVVTVESDRYTVERRSVSALTSSAGHYTTTYRFLLRDGRRAVEARMGTVVRGRFHEPDALAETFAAAGFDSVEVVDAGGPAILHARA
jgi:SAM-dependent methyltransferase